MLVDLIQPLLAPAVLVSASGLLVMALNARVMTAKGRIRQFHNERLKLCQTVTDQGAPTPTQLIRDEGLKVQSHHLLCRLRLIRSALMSYVICVSLLLTSSLLIGLSAWQASFGHAAIIVFILGVLSMLTGSIIFLAELRISLHEVSYEHQRIMALPLVDSQEPS